MNGAERSAKPVVASIDDIVRAVSERGARGFPVSDLDELGVCVMRAALRPQATTGEPVLVCTNGRLRLHIRGRRADAYVRDLWLRALRV